MLTLQNFLKRFAIQKNVIITANCDINEPHKMWQETTGTR